jgi:hypothetical protein
MGQNLTRAPQQNSANYSITSSAMASSVCGNM